MKWPYSIQWNPMEMFCWRHTSFLWPYIYGSLNIRWQSCTPMCHWLRDITLSSNEVCATVEVADTSIHVNRFICCHRTHCLRQEKKLTLLQADVVSPCEWAFKSQSQSHQVHSLSCLSLPWSVFLTFPDSALIGRSSARHLRHESAEFTIKVRFTSNNPHTPSSR